MSSQKAIAPLLTPIIGMMPVVAFFFFDSFFSYHVALIAALVTYIAYFLIGVVWLKYDPPYTILISTISFLIFIGLSVITPFNLLYIKKASVFLSLSLVCVFYIFTRIQGYFRAKILLKDDITQEFKILKFDAELYAMKMVLFTQILYLLIILVYQLFPDNYHSLQVDFFIYHLIILLFIVIHVGYEFIHWNMIRKRMNNEEWLPIVDESGGVHGRVALSATRTSGDKYLHPVIRIALINKGHLYLQERSAFPLSEANYLDYPFERYLRFEETLDEGVKEAFIENGGADDLPSRFIFRYVDKNIETNRLIYLYASNITDDKLLDKLNLNKGKWWTGKQIDENLGTGLFSPCFEKEYELLNTTILMADRLMRDMVLSQDN